MGGELSAEYQERFVSEAFQAVQSRHMLPDIGIDDSIMKYSGLYSASALEDYFAQLVNDLTMKSPDLVKDLGSILSNFVNIPNAAGLGALMISFILDITVSGLTKATSDINVLGMMRRVFAEEKASRVRDTMDEYVKRFRLKMHEPEELLHETKRIEAQLSDGLTRLRNSMLHDNQISSRFMKQWTNGAAFHVQMLVHVARMETAKSSRSEVELDKHVVSVSSLAEHYEDDLQKLLEKYETYKRSTIYTDFTDMRSATLYGTVNWYVDCGVHDTELREKVGLNYNDLTGPQCRSMTNPYHNYMFNNWSQIKELREYFPRLKQNLRQTIMQNSAFNIQKFLPGTRKTK